MSRAGGSYKDRKRNQVCVCAFCKQVFYATRRDAKTCTPAHRKAYERMQKEDQMVVTDRREVTISMAGKVVATMTLPGFDQSGRVFAKVVN